MPNRIVASLGILVCLVAPVATVAQSPDDAVLSAPAGVERLRIDQATGHVGIGTAGAQPNQRLQVRQDVDANTILVVDNTHAGLSAASVLRANTGTAFVNLIAHGPGRTLSRFGQVLASWTELLQVSGNGLILGTFTEKPLILGTGNVERMRVTSAGLTVQGGAHFNGVVTGTEIRATYQDVAEWVPSRQDLAPGTVVVLDPAVGNGVIASTNAYDTTVAGVVSAQPGLLLGLPGDAKEQIATTGRVRVRVDATPAPIRVGDLLVTGEKPGTAMRSEPVEIHGRSFHQPGTILGKALEPLAGGEGEILVLLSLQ